MTRTLVRRLALGVAILATVAVAALPAAMAADQTPGGVAVILLDPKGAPIPGGCFTVSSRAGVVAANCDAYDGSTDGTTLIPNVPPGNYTVSEFFLPPGYLYDTQARPVTVTAGQIAPLIIQPQPGGARVVVTTRDLQGQPVPGACYSVYADAGDGVPGTGAGGGCDIFDGKSDGTTSFGSSKDGAFLLIMSAIPDGYVVPDPRPVVLTAGQTAGEGVTLQPGGQTVTVHDVDQQNHPLPGFCFQVFQDVGTGQRGPFVEMSCDSYYDGKLDGIISLRGLPPGSYILAQPGPLPGYTAAADQSFVVQAGRGLSLVATTARATAPAARPTATPRATLPAAASTAPPAAPAPSTPAPPPAAGAFAVGSTATVTVDGLHLRDQPSINGTIVGTLNTGDQVTITGAPKTADGYTWYPVTTATGAPGYVAGQFLQAG